MSLTVWRVRAMFQILKAIIDVDANTVSKLVELTVKAEMGAYGSRINRLEKDVEKLTDKFEGMKARIDFAEGAELNIKITKILSDVEELKITDAKVLERMVTVFNRLNMKKEAGDAQNALTSLKLHVEGDAQINQVGNDQDVRRSS